MIYSKHFIKNKMRLRQQNVTQIVTLLHLAALNHNKM